MPGAWYRRNWLVVSGGRVELIRKLRMYCIVQVPRGSASHREASMSNHVVCHCMTLSLIGDGELVLQDDWMLRADRDSSQTIDSNGCRAPIAIGSPLVAALASSMSKCAFKG